MSNQNVLVAADVIVNVKPLMSRQKNLPNLLNVVLAAGDIYGLIGLNGAGKSTLVRVLAGLQRPSKGEVRVNGYSYRTQPLQAKMLVGIVSREVIPYSRLTGLEYATFIGKMFGIKNAIRNAKIREMFRLLGIEEHENKLIIDYSDGMRQKLALDCALINNPKVLILDEPFAGVDEIAIEAILPLIYSLMLRRHFSASLPS